MRVPSPATRGRVGGEIDAKKKARLAPGFLLRPCRGALPPKDAAFPRPYRSIPKPTPAELSSLLNAPPRLKDARSPIFFE